MQGAADLAGAGWAFVAFFAGGVGGSDASEGPLFAALDLIGEGVEVGGVRQSLGAGDDVQTGWGGWAVWHAGDDAGAVVAPARAVLGLVQVEDGIDAQGVELAGPVGLVGVAAVGDELADSF